MAFSGPPILLELSPPVGVVATRRQAAQWELGRVRVDGADRGGTTVEVHLPRAEGRGRWRAGLWWDDEAEPRWADSPRRLARDAVAIPIHADDGLEHMVRVMVEVQPLGPLGRASAVFAAWFVA